MTRSRHISRTLVCVICGQSYHPWSDAKPGGKYCSARCRSSGVMASLNGSSAPSVPPPIRPAYAPESEPPNIPHTPHTPSDTLTGEDYGREWKESGEHWQRVAAWIIARRETQRRRALRQRDDALYRTLANEGRAITMGGVGAGLFVKNGQLIVKQG